MEEESLQDGTDKSKLRWYGHEKAESRKKIHRDEIEVR